MNVFFLSKVKSFQKGQMLLFKNKGEPFLNELMLLFIHTITHIVSTCSLFSMKQMYSDSEANDT